MNHRAGLGVLEKRQDRQYKFKRNNGARSRNQCGREIARIITFAECVVVALHT